MPNGTPDVKNPTQTSTSDFGAVNSTFSSSHFFGANGGAPGPDVNASDFNADAATPNPDSYSATSI